MSRARQQQLAQQAAAGRQPVAGGGRPDAGQAKAKTAARPPSAGLERRVQDVQQQAPRMQQQVPLLVLHAQQQQRARQQQQAAQLQRQSSALAPKPKAAATAAAAAAAAMPAPPARKAVFGTGAAGSKAAGLRRPLPPKVKPSLPPAATAAVALQRGGSGSDALGRAFSGGRSGAAGTFIIPKRTLGGTGSGELHSPRQQQLQQQQQREGVAVAPVHRKRPLARDGVPAAGERDRDRDRERDWDRDRERDWGERGRSKRARAGPSAAEVDAATAAESAVAAERGAVAALGAAFDPHFSTALCLDNLPPGLDSAALRQGLEGLGLSGFQVSKGGGSNLLVQRWLCVCVCVGGPESTLPCPFK